MSGRVWENSEPMAGVPGDRGVDKDYIVEHKLQESA
jgi:hypothetical protein